MAKRGPKSKISRLDPAIKAELDRLLFHEGRSIDDVVEYLQGLHLDDAPSRASIGRYSASTHKIRDDMNKLKAVSEQLAEEFGDEDNARARFNLQVAQSMLFKLLENASGEEAAVTVKDFQALMKGMKDLYTARKSTVDAEQKIVLLKEKTAKVIEEAERTISEAQQGGEQVDPMAVLKRIREDVYGIFQ